MSEGPVRIVTGGELSHSFPFDLFEGRASFLVAHTDDELRAAVKSADVLYSWQVPELIPGETPALRWIQLPSAGADHVRTLPVWGSDITITASQGIHAVPMAEHLFALLLALTRQVSAIVRAQDKHEWHQLNVEELRGRTMGIIGWGKVGDGIAHLARAFGMQVIGTRWSVVAPRSQPREGIEAFEDPPWLEPADVSPDTIYPAAQLHEVLAQSDIVVVILPLTSETEHSFGETEFAEMRRGSLFFNIGRGAVVDEEALIQALRSGRLRGAGLDVFASEPLAHSSPLWNMHNVIVSPHVGGVGEHTRKRAAQFFAVNLTRFLEGKTLLNVVERSQEY
jgi:D-2-hydroxyacid dehydrogenase (NADP+)